MDAFEMDAFDPMIHSSQWLVVAAAGLIAWFQVFPIGS
jgi:hypothetical protein